LFSVFQSNKESEESQKKAAKVKKESVLSNSIKTENKYKGHQKPCKPEKKEKKEEKSSNPTKIHITDTDAQVDPGREL